MPAPKPGESKVDYLARCVPVLVREGKSQDQAVAVCSAMFTEAKKKSALSIIESIVEKCGGPGGKPGPCPGGGAPRNSKPRNGKPQNSKPRNSKPQNSKPKNRPEAEGKPKKKLPAKYAKIDSNNPKPKIKKAQLLSGKMSIKDGKLSIHVTVNPKEAIMQLKVVQAIKKKADSMVAAVKNALKEGDQFRSDVLVAAASARRAFKATVANARRVLAGAGKKPSKAVDLNTQDDAEGEDLGEIVGEGILFDTEGDGYEPTYF